MARAGLSDEEIYLRLQRLIADMPDFLAERGSTETAKWLGEAEFLVEETNHQRDLEALEEAIEDLRSPISIRLSTIPVVMFRVLARAEAKAPVSARGGFIPVGKPLDAMATVARLLGEATDVTLVVDPYAEASLLTDFLPATPQKVSVRVLSDERTHKPTLKPAAERWVEQFGVTRPLEVRVAPSRSLHDRLIFLDSKEVWVLGQSFNALAVRSPTSLLKADPELAKMKIDAYGQIWDAATPLP